MSRPTADFIPLYGVKWSPTVHPLTRELDCIGLGGRWQQKNGKMAGNGNTFHYKEAIKIIWPEIGWHFWNELLLEHWLQNRCIAVLGPTNSGKTNSFAIFHLVDYYAFPTQTTVLVCSTTKDRLEDRIWGEMKKWHRLAKKRFSWLSGNLIEGKLRIVTDARSEADEGRDFRNGLVGVPCKKSGEYTGLGDFIGIKNKRVRLCGDELQLLPRAFIDSIPNLIKNANCKVTGLGNPKETTDALGALAEPAASLGGWDGGIDQTPKTKTWQTRWPDGVCIQLCGLDSPNTRVPDTLPVPFPFLITRKQIDDDANTWGRDDWHFTMFNEGRMPRGQGSRRVITRRLCEKGGAFMEPRWNDANFINLGCLDAAYRAVGGDRCVYMHLRMGREAPIDLASAVTGSLINQQYPNPNLRMLLALIEMKIIPIAAGIAPAQEDAEDQIVEFVKAENQQRGIPPQNFFYDSGMRTSLVQAFDRKYSNKVNSIDCGGRPSETRVSEAIDVPCCDYYSKLITELWYSVRLIFEAGQFRGLTQDIMAEGCAREWKLVGGNKIEIESKVEMKKKTGRSPDLFDCLAIGCEGAKRLGFRIGRMRDVEEEESDQKWKSELREKAAKLARAGALNYAA